MSPTFFCIVEGVTDFKIIRKILQRHYDNPNIKVECIQPKLDETNLNQINFGGWGNALNYLKSEDFKIEIDFADYIIIHIDSDTSRQYGISYRKLKSNKDISNFWHEIKERIIEEMDASFYKKVKEKLIFAIAIDSTECWLLPLLYNDSRKTKFTNCLNSLNQKLKKDGFTIDVKAKNKGAYYDLLLKKISRKKLLKCAKHQVSLDLFLKSLPVLE